jgi:hypothetical protein
MKNVSKHVVVSDSNHFEKPNIALKIVGSNMSAIGNNHLDWY